MAENDDVPAAAADGNFPFRGNDGRLRDALIAEDAPVVRLSRFEGPLDLLLFLIRKNELDICDIPIESVTRQYIQILRGNERLDLEIAGEFFVMASTLMYIKSRMLLPAGTAGDDALAGTENADDTARGNDPRWELVQRLLEYKRLKDAAQTVAELAEKRSAFPDRKIAPAEDAPARPLVPVGKMDVWNAFNLVLKRLADRIVPGEIRGDSVTVAQRMEEILERARSEKSFTFSSLLPAKTSVALLVSTFLACLELARLGKLSVRQNDTFGEIYCDARDAVPADSENSENAANSENPAQSVPAESGELPLGDF